MVISRNRWLIAWLGLEINLICFIPFLIKDYKIHSNAGRIYFLVQAVGSLMILILGISFWYFEESKFWVRVALLLKVGAAPLHFWYIQVAKCIKWICFLVLGTIQKIAPLILLSINRIDLFKREIYLRAIARRLIGGLGGLYTLSLRELLVYSSINHLGWILVSLTGSNLFWITYLIIYCLILALTVGILIAWNLYHLSQLVRVNITWGRKIALVIRIISLGGIPPFIGFIPKWGVIVSEAIEINLLCLIILIISSVISLYYYIRVRFSLLLINSIGKIIFSRYIKVAFRGRVIFVNLVGFWVRPLVKLRFLQ